MHVPYLLRLVRLVVVLNKSYRGKYARFVKLKNVVRMWAAVSLAILAFATALFIKSPDFSSRSVQLSISLSGQAAGGGCYKA